LLAITAFILCLSLIAAPRQAGAQTVQVNVATDITDPFEWDDSEPSIAVNPLNPNEITIITFSEGWDDTTPAPVWRSFDGGMTWIKQFIVAGPLGSFGPGDQKAAYDAQGRLVLAE